jgi:prolipoprotein diacylglyceryl transferase
MLEVVSGLLPGAALPTFIPSPDQGVWNIGPLPVRAYAIFIVIGIVLAVWIGEKRWVARGGAPGTIGDVALWAVPFGIVGGRLYHVISDNQIYFSEGGSGFSGAIRIWDGGLGIWGAVLGGGVGAWIAVRRRGIPLPPLGDSIAPGIVLAQAIGRLGNYFNQELFGSPTEAPWGLEIDLANRPAGFEEFATFHPTFLYEALWNLGVFAVLIIIDRRMRIGHGRLFALYVALYCLGRVWIESLRIDTANEILGLRLNVWTSIVVGLGAVVYIIISARMRPGREAPEDLRANAEAPENHEPDMQNSKNEAAVTGDTLASYSSDTHDSDINSDSDESESGRIDTK